MEKEEVTNASEHILSLEICEEQLRSIGLSDQQIKDLGEIIDTISDTILDQYFAEFYE